MKLLREIVIALMCVCDHFVYTNWRHSYVSLSKLSNYHFLLARVHKV